MDAAARVSAWVADVRAAYRPASSGAVDAIVAESGLRRPAVEYAIDRLLEVDVSSEEIAAFVEGARRLEPRTAIAVVLSANVFTAPFRAIAWALARSPRVLVRTSRRASAFLHAVDTELVTKLGDAPELSAVVDALPNGGALHVYGGASTNDRAARAVRGASSSITLEAHGPGFGAIVAPGRAIIERAEAVALDVAAFDTRGCLSPRLVFALDDAHAASEALHRALDRLDNAMPRGALTEEESRDRGLAVESARFSGRALVGAGHAVLDLGEAPGTPMGPVGRIVPVVAVGSLDDALDRLAPVARDLTTLALADVDDATLRRVTARLAFAGRISRLGEMQRPPFLGPVDLRAIPL